MASGRICCWLVALLGLCGCLAQEPSGAMDTTQARVRELRRLAFESGLDVTGVYDEEELLAEIAQHPRALQTLRVRRARARARPRGPGDGRALG